MALSDNPLWFREQRTRQARRTRYSWGRRLPDCGLVVVWLFPLLATVALTNWEAGCQTRSIPYLYSRIHDTAMVCLFFQVIYLSLRALLAGSLAISRERDQQTWETLISSPIGLGRLVAGKVIAVVVPLLCELAFATPFLLIVCCARNPWEMNLCTPVFFVQILTLSLLCILFFSSLGLLISAYAPASRAAARAILVGVSLLAGTYIADMFLNQLAHVRGPALSVLNPISALSSIVNPSAHNPFLSPALALGTMVSYAVLSLLLLAATRHRLEQESVR